MSNKMEKQKNIGIGSNTLILALAGFAYVLGCGYLVGVYASGKELNYTYSGLFVFVGGFLLANDLFFKPKDRP